MVSDNYEYYFREINERMRGLTSRKEPDVNPTIKRKFLRGDQPVVQVSPVKVSLFQLFLIQLC